MKARPRKVTHGVIRFDEGETAWLYEWIHNPDELPLLEWYKDNQLVELLAWYDVLEANKLDRQPIPLGVTFN